MVVWIDLSPLLSYSRQFMFNGTHIPLVRSTALGITNTYPASGCKTLESSKKSGARFQALSEPLLLEIAKIAIYICCALAVCSETHRLLSESPLSLCAL